MRIRRLRNFEPTVAATGRTPVWGARAGFTLSEMMVSLTILVIVSAGIISSHWFGLRMFQITQTQLGAKESTHKEMVQLMDEIRSAKTLLVGQGNVRGFAEAGVDTPQQGNAIQLYASGDTNTFVRYYWDKADLTLKRMTQDAATLATVAGGVSNSVLFTCQDYAGNVLTNAQGSCTLAVLLQFSELQESHVPIGPGNHYDSYQLQAKITRRAAE